MTPDMTLSSTQTISLLSNGKAQQPRQETVPAPPVITSVVVAKEAQQKTEDTVSLSPQLQQALAESEKKETKKLETEPANSEAASNRSAAKVEFVYDLKGELITRYLDSSNRLVYQAPSELMLLMKDSDSKSRTAVNTKV